MSIFQFQLNGLLEKIKLECLICFLFMKYQIHNLKFSLKVVITREIIMTSFSLKLLNVQQFFSCKLVSIKFLLNYYCIFPRKTFSHYLKYQSNPLSWKENNYCPTLLAVFFHNTDYNYLKRFLSFTMNITAIIASYCYYYFFILKEHFGIAGD